MTAILPPQQGNTIVPTPASANATPFPFMVLAGMIVAAGVYLTAEFDDRAAWLLAFLVLLAIAFRYKTFGDEITSLLGVAPTTANQKTNG